MVGCADPAAYNYDPAVTVASEAACSYLGCLVPVALDFDSVATLHDQSCRYPVLGCTRPEQLGYHSAANEDDGSCREELPGCAHAFALNFDSTATAADASCTYGGCTDPAADSFVAAATVDDGSCISLRRGCMAPLADNFDPAARADDGSCTYAVPGCNDPAALNWFPLASAALGCRYAGCMVAAAPNYNPSAVVSDGSCLPALRASGTVATFGYMSSCFTFVAADDGTSAGATAWGVEGAPSQPNGTTDATGAYALRYYPSQRGLVQAMPSGADGACTDVLLGSTLRVPLLTTAGAAMATQLTTLAALLVRDGGMGEAAASATLASALGLPPQDVWTFDAFGATMFGEPAMQASDMLWLVRQMQVSVTVDCLGRAFAGGDTYSDYTYAGADGTPDGTDPAPARAAFGVLASMLQEAKGSAVVNLADPTRLLELAGRIAGIVGGAERKRVVINGL